MSQILASPWAIGHRRLVRRLEHECDPNAVTRAVRTIEGRAFELGRQHAIDGWPEAIKETIGRAFYACYLAGFATGRAQILQLDAMLAPCGIQVPVGRP